MPKKRTPPTTFDGWLGNVAEGLVDSKGGRPAAALHLDVSEKTIQRKIAGITPFTVRELERLADLVRIPAAEMVRTALTQYGDGDLTVGLKRMMSEGRDIPDAPVDISSRRGPGPGPSQDEVEQYRGDKAADSDPEIDIDSTEPDAP